MRFYLLFLIVFYSCCFNDAKSQVLKAGYWTGSLDIPNQHIPFKIKVRTFQKECHITLYNGSEEINLQEIKPAKDSLILKFSTFDSELRLHKTAKKQWIGHWYNGNKNNYYIPCTLTYGYETRFQPTNNQNKPKQLAEKWECTFGIETTDSYKTIGLFKQENKSVTGTFLTETGDYRFLEGNMYGDSLFLSGFDGSHAFLFVALLKEDSLFGTFYSGKHFKTKWMGIPNPKFQLANPEQITQLIQQETFDFTLPQLSGEAFRFREQHDSTKVTILQIMGTWCPNCLDETIYFKSLYDTFGPNQLEILAIGYEIGNTFEDHVKKLISFKTRMNLPFTFLVGGKADKQIAASQFPMLSSISSFPTTLILDKQGKIRKIYTGFNGPGTGNYFETYKVETEAFIKSLLKE